MTTALERVRAKQAKVKVDINTLPIPNAPRTMAKIEEQVSTARDLSQELSGSINQRMEEDRTIVLTMRQGLKPEITFTGFWNGRLVKNAQNAISRGYRLRRHKDIRVHASVPNPEGEAK